MSEEAIAHRVIRVIAKNKKMAPEELSPATRFDNLKMGFARWLKHDLRPRGRIRHPYSQ
jgi:hypothetical protein